MYQTQVPHVLSFLKAHPPHRHALLVAIDGAGGSGKSTLARELRDASAEITIIHGDDFYRVLDERVRTALDPAEGYRTYFDWERLRDQVLLPLVAGQPARFQRYDWSLNQLSADSLTVEPSGTIIVEGVYTMRPELLQLYDATIFVTTAQEERMQRLKVRGENPVEWINRWAAAEDWYLEHVRPWTDANLIVSGSQPVQLDRSVS